MIKKITFSALGLLLTCPLAALAQNNTHPVTQVHHVTHYHHHAHYKGDALYKGELYRVAVAPVPESVPCTTFTFDSGFYLGMSPGIVTTYTASPNSVYKGFQGTIFAGYAYVSSFMYLAAEFFAQHDAQIQNYAANQNSNGNAIGVRSTYGGGFSLIPGVILADTVMGFLRIGTVTTHFYDVAETKTGGQVGVGLQVATSESWNIRAEYDYAFYSSLTNIGTPRSDSYRLGFIYKI